jgi:uncharacterized protein (TIGR02246 family)
MTTRTDHDQRARALDERDVADLAGIPLGMADAWNRGDAEGFAARFSETADFIAFEGTHLKGRDEIVAFHQHIFATVVKGSRLDPTVRFVRLISPDVAVIHSAVEITLAGHDRPSPGRKSMQLYVALRDGATWYAEAMENARQLTLECQAMLDAYDDLGPDARSEVDALLAPTT